MIYCVDSFELPMKSLRSKKPKRTTSMLSLKVHVDKEDYQSEAGGGNGDAPENGAEKEAKEHRETEQGE